MLTSKPPADERPITGTEVQEWFQESIGRGKPIPDERTCQVIAEMLCAWQPGGFWHGLEVQRRWLDLPISEAEIAERKRWTAAAKAIRSALRQRSEIVEQASGVGAPWLMLKAMSQLESALAEAEGWFGWAPVASGAAWHPIAHNVLYYAQLALSWDRNRRAGLKNPNNPAVKVARLALVRLGFPEATHAAIADISRPARPIKVQNVGTDAKRSRKRVESAG